MTSRISRFWLLVFLFTVAGQLLADTWYVRADGGTRYSANATSGQCDGKADAAYPGSGTNQHCAFNDARYLWDDQATYGSTKWVIAGGDTVILDNTKAWRVGFNQGSSPNDAWCFGGSGPFACTNPVIPAGTATQHTRILGRNWASCSANNAGDPSRMSELIGGFGVSTALNLQGAQYVDVQCLQIDRHSQCATHGVPVYPSGCSTSFPLDDYDSDGIVTDQSTHDVTLQDLWVHGHTDRGIKGPIGGLVTANRVNVSYNGMAGWDFDDGNGTPSVNAVLKMNWSVIEWNGCNQEYPITHAFPAAGCFSQSTGGYGDGIGTPSNDSMDVYIDHSIFRYNTQDGEDFGHIDTGAHTLSITNSASYANNGGQFKWGGNFTSVTFENNFAVGNCLRMSQPINGAPSTFNAHLGDFCRAFDALSFNFRQGATALFANNTIVSYSPTTFDVQCWDASCSNTVFTLRNNIVRGYDNPTTYNMGGQAGGPGLYCMAGCNGSTGVIGTINRSNNIYYGIRQSCPANTLGNAGGSAVNESCLDPNFTGEPATFTDETVLDGFVFTLAAGSPAQGAGVAIPGLTTDFDNLPYLVPPSLGGVEFGSQASLLTLFTSPSLVTATATPVVATPVATVATLVAAPVASLNLTTTVTTTVKAASGAAIPTGTVTLYYGSIPLVSGTLDKTGSVSWTLAAVLEKFGVVAKYTGPSSFLASTSNVLALALKK